MVKKLLNQFDSVSRDQPRSCPMKSSTIGDDKGFSRDSFCEQIRVNKSTLSVS